MVSIQALLKVSTVYVHKDCGDGLAAAMIIQDAYRMAGKTVVIKFVAHNTKAQDGYVTDICGDPTCEFALYCDITPSRDSVQTYGAPDNVIVLDHHLEQKDVTESFKHHVFAHEEKEPGVSGAVLAFREVWEPINKHVGAEDFLFGNRVQFTRAFATDVGARDTGQKKNPRFMRGQWTNAMLMSKPPAYWLAPRGTSEFGDPQIPEPYLFDAEVRQGQLLFELRQEAVQEAIKQCLVMEVDGAVLMVFQECAAGPRLTTDVAWSLQEGVGIQPKPKRGVLLAGFSYVMSEGQPLLVYSLRSVDGFDVGKLAKVNGGGGHSKAGGFSVRIRREGAIVNLDPYETMRERVERFILTGDGWATPYKETP